MGRKKKIEKQDDISIAQIITSKFGRSVQTTLDKLDAAYTIPTNVMSIDISIGKGVSPGITEIFGNEAAGKTSLALKIIKNAQDIGIDAFYIDMERGLTASLVNTIDGLNKDKLRDSFFRPKHGNEAVDMCELIIKQSPKSLIVLDSIPACISSAQIEESANKDFMAPIARIFSTFLPKIKSLLFEQESCLLLLNQLRDNLSPYGANDSTPGGRAIKFYADRRIQLKKSKKIKKSNTIIGNYVKVQCVKNKFATPYQSCEVPFIYGMGFSRELDLAMLAIQCGILKKAGAWFNYKEWKWQGEVGLAEGLVENKEAFNLLRKEVVELLNYEDN